MEAPGRLLRHPRRHLELPVKPAAACAVVFHNRRPHSFLCPPNNSSSSGSSSNPFRQFLSLSSLQSNSALHRFSVNSYSSFQDQNYGGSLPLTLDWYGPGGAFGYRDGDRDVAVVVLGWLGAQEKHLRRYLEWYNSRGYRAEGFIVGVGEILWKFDFARSVEERIDAFVGELVEWVMKGKGIGKERSLVFHCFSNTGWLVYGAFLEKILEKEGLFDWIKGCIVDSGGGELTNIKVWSAGFATAMLRKQISATYILVGEKGVLESKNGHASSIIAGQSCGDRVVETLLLAALEKFFFVLLNFPYSQRYGDYFAPDAIAHGALVQTIEAFMDYQRKLGRKVFARDFKTTPHVDHYRTFPHLYLSELDIFLKECFDKIKK